MASAWNIVCDQRATFTQTFTWRDLDDDLVDLTGYSSALMEVRPAPGETAVLTLSTANSRITLGGAAGTIALSVDDAVTEALDPGTYQYDLTLTTTGGDVVRLLEGVFTVNEAVTQV